MWTDLFKPASSQAGKRDVDCVECVDPLPAAKSAGAVECPEKVAEFDDRVGAYQLAPFVPSHAFNAPTRPVAIPAATSPYTVQPTVSASCVSTQSTQSTPGKFCRLLTVAERSALLALFEPDVAFVETLARSGDSGRAAELRRAINVVWRLITVEGWDFDKATMTAADWVVTQPIHPDELFFGDVPTFSKCHYEK